MSKSVGTEAIAGDRGTRLMTAANYTGLTANGFECDTAGTISKLFAVSKRGGTPFDVLTDHIVGGVSTTVAAGTLIKCQFAFFTEITIATGQFNEMK